MKWLEFCLQAPIKSLYLRGWKSEIKGIFHYPNGKAGDDDIYILDIVKSGCSWGKLALKPSLPKCWFNDFFKPLFALKIPTAWITRDFLVINFGILKKEFLLS